MTNSDLEPYAVGEKWFVNRSGGREGPFDSCLQARRYLDLLRIVTAVRLGTTLESSQYNDTTGN